MSSDKFDKYVERSIKGLRKKPNALTQPFLDYTALRGSRSIATAKLYRAAIERFTWFISEIRGKQDILSATKEDFVALHTFMMECTYAPRAQQTMFKVLGIFFNWCVLEGKIQEKCLPKINAVGNKRLVMHDYFVPRPEDIFRLRGTRRPSIEEAAALEVLLSSGIRVGLLLQLTAADFRFDEDCIPFDYELKIRSPYCGGSILVRPDILITKSRGYVTYISKLAARLVRECMAMNNIPEKSQIPLFPFEKGRWIARIRELADFMYAGKVLNDFDSVNKLIPDKNGPVREFGFTQLDVDSLPVSEELKIRIKRQQVVAGELKEEYGPLSSISDVEAKVLQQHYNQPVHLGAHALRRLFTCVMFYRNYHGERGNLERLRDMLGHSDIKMTHVYLSQLELIADEKMWRRLMLGKGSDWLGLRVKQCKKSKRDL